MSTDGHCDIFPDCFRGSTYLSITKVEK